MKIICSGAPKTGTKTLSAALRILGYSVYDFEEQFWFQKAEWKRVLKEGCSTEEFRKMFQDVDSATDIPACIFWEELHRAFPDAKIIHTERESDEEWYTSYLKQIKVARGNLILRMLMNLSFTGRAIRTHLNDAIRAQFSIPPFSPIVEPTLNPTLLKLRYRQHNARVKEVLPKDKILFFNLHDGWEPLCKFLDVPVPSQPFPHRNKGGNIVEELVDKSYIFHQTRKEIAIMLSLFMILFSMLLYFYAF